MRCAPVFQKQSSVCLQFIFVILVTLTVSFPSFAQTQTQPATSPDAQVAKAFGKYPGLMPELGKLVQRMQTEIQFPARSSSRLLPLLPKSTVFYVAFPNYGEASNQALEIFHQQLKVSPALSAWWQQGEMAKDGPEIEDALEKVYQVSQYLGDEIVLSASDQGSKETNLLVLAEVRKPGLKQSLSQFIAHLSPKSAPKFTLLDPQELASAKEVGPDQAVILIRPDIVAIAPRVATLREFNASLDGHRQEFAATDFGQRVARVYDKGATVIGAVNVQRLLKQMPSGDAKKPVFQHTGFDDAKYLVWEQSTSGNESSSEIELSFNGPRQGIASWLATPAPKGSLEFISPKATFAISVSLKDLGQVWDDIRDLATTSNKNPFAFVDQMEAAMQLSVKEDLLRQLGGEITLEAGPVLAGEPSWAAVLSVRDAAHLQNTLNRLLVRTQMRAEQFEKDGVTYHELRLPSRQKTTYIDYAFVDGYLIVASGRDKLSEAIDMRKSGASLAKSRNFLTALPHGSGDVSALFYEDATAVAALMMGRLMPGMASSLTQSGAEASPLLMCAYGDEAALRGASRSAGANLGVVMIAAAIAVPNLLRARMAANEASAVANIRTVDTAQLSYATLYPARGFARSLSALGQDPRRTRSFSPAHAGLIDNSLGNSSCTVGVWCTKSGFNFMIRTACQNLTKCNDFVVVATPVSANTGAKNFCSTSDMVVRSQTATPLTAPISARECRTWAPIQ